MRYSVYVGGKMPLAYYSPEMTGFYNLKKIKVSVISTIALPETAGFYNSNGSVVYNQRTIALPEMAGFYNGFSIHIFFLTTALPETAGLW